MAITIKFVVVFVFSVLFIVSSVHCRQTTSNIPGYGVKQMDRQCFHGNICRGGVGDCIYWCRNHGYYYGVCLTDACCCQI
ncbi:hypothetical protein N665_2750s0001 [Sinapis alba]|nr:hypothetical protein N665_2750s0001 [Sinapis alba]